jgi:hypothetical protein
MIEDLDYWDPSDLSPNQYDAILKQSFATVLDALSASDWSSQSGTATVEQSSRPQPGSSLFETRGIGEIPLDCFTILHLFGQGKYRPLYDTLFDRQPHYQSIDRLTSIKFSQFKAPWPVSKREVLSINRTVKLPNNGESHSQSALLSWATSIEVPEIPVTKGYVRANLKYYGLLVRPLDHSNTRCQVTYLQSSDPLGDLPQKLVNATSSDKALAIQTINQLIEQRNPAIEEAKKEIYEEIAKWRESKAN